MNGGKYLMDTNLVLYLLGGEQTLAKYLYQKNLYISFITEIELLAYKKLSAKEEKGIRNFLAQLRIINIDEAIKIEAINLRKQYSLKLPDCIIAATAESLQLPLITADTQFRQIQNLQLELYQP